MGSKFLNPSLAFWVTVVILCTACSGGADERPPFRSGRPSYDTTPFDLTGFADDRDLQYRILSMPFGEAAARLGSLRFDAVSNFEFSRGGEIYEQRDTSAVQQDVEGNFHIKLETPTSQVEFYLAGEDVYVRLDRGQLRKKARREVETEATCEIAFAAIHQTLDLFRPRLLFVDATPSDIDGRPVMRYSLALGKAGQPSPAVSTDGSAYPGSNLLPVAPPPRWRELARPLDVNGKIWIDRPTGVVLKSEVRGRFEIPDRDVRPTQLTLAFSAAISKIGAVNSVEVPNSIPESRRRAPPRDLLSFFRDHLPAPEPSPEPPTQTP